jgi:hypothetical protein
MCKHSEIFDIVSMECMYMESKRSAFGIVTIVDAGGESI